MSGESEYIFQIFRGIRQSHVHVQQIGVMSFLYEGFTDSCSGDQGDVTLRAQSSCQYNDLHDNIAPLICYISAGNEPGRHAGMSVWRLLRGI